MKTLKKKSRSIKKTYAIVASRFNEFITKRLLDGCLDEFKKLGVKKDQIKVFWVPGAFDIPVVALKLAKKKSINAVVCLGAVIRGETYHFELVAQGAAQGITQAALTTGKPVILGVLTTDTVNQAYVRAEEKGDNKGRDAARAAVDMVSVLEKV